MSIFYCTNVHLGRHTLLYILTISQVSNFKFRPTLCARVYMSNSGFCQCFTPEKNPNYLVAHQCWKCSSNFMTVQRWRRRRSEKNKNESNRNLNLHQIWHFHTSRQSNQSHQGFIQTFKGSYHGHCTLCSWSQLALDVVFLCGLGQISWWATVLQTSSNFNLGFFFSPSEQYFWLVPVLTNLRRFMVIHWLDTVNAMSIIFFEKQFISIIFFRIVLNWINNH